MAAGFGGADYFQEIINCLIETYGVFVA